VLLTHQHAAHTLLGPQPAQQQQQQAGNRRVGGNACQQKRVGGQCKAIKQQILTALLMARSYDAPNLGAFNLSQPLLSNPASPACLMLLLQLHKECILLKQIRTPHLNAYMH
jgi:hypothetical protein